MNDIKFLKEFFSRLKDGSVPGFCGETDNSIQVESYASAETIMAIIEMMGLQDRTKLEKWMEGNKSIIWNIVFDLDDHAEEKDYSVSFYCGDNVSETQYFDTIEEACTAAICWSNNEAADALYIARKNAEGKIDDLMFMNDDAFFELYIKETDKDYNVLVQALRDAKIIN